MLVALMVPIAAASNSTVLRCSRTYDGAGANEIPVVLAGAVISTLVALLLSWPLVATRRDMLPVGAWAGCNWRFLACVRACWLCLQVLQTPELPLLCLLGVVFGILLV